MKRKTGLMDSVRKAIKSGKLGSRFRPGDLKKACPGFAPGTYAVFPNKHRRGNPGGYTEYFNKHSDGSFSIL